MSREQWLERVFDLVRRKRILEKEVSKLKNEAQKYNSGWGAFAAEKQIPKLKLCIEKINEELDPLLA